MVSTAITNGGPATTVVSIATMKVASMIVARTKALRS
jgi:hypothetical protein